MEGGAAAQSARWGLKLKMIFSTQKFQGFNLNA
jgi:hypothetical protein